MVVSLLVDEFSGVNAIPGFEDILLITMYTEYLFLLFEIYIYRSLTRQIPCEVDRILKLVFQQILAKTEPQKEFGLQYNL